jgi:hypothetical protein
LPKFSADLHDKYRKLVPIVDAGMAADDLKNKYYVMAQDKKALIQSTINTNPDYKGALVQ